MKIYLHCGAGKTGTTSLQYLLSSQSKDLCDSGLFVPKQPDDWLAGNGEGLYFYLDNGRIEDATALLAQYIADAKKNNCIAVCLSCELILDLQLSQKIQLFKLLSKMFTDIFVVICIRSPMDWLRSAYFQQVNEDMINADSLKSHFFLFCANHVSAQLGGAHELVSVASQFKCTYQITPYISSTSDAMNYTLSRIFSLMCGANPSTPGVGTLVGCRRDIRKRLTKPWSDSFASLTIDNSILNHSVAVRDVTLPLAREQMRDQVGTMIHAIVPVSYAQYTHYMRRIVVVCARNGHDPLDRIGATHLSAMHPETFIRNVYMFVTNSFHDLRLARLVLGLMNQHGKDLGGEIAPWVTKTIETYG